MSNVAHIRRMEKRDDFENTLIGSLPRLPAYLDGNIKLFEFNENSRHGSFWFFTILGELQTESDENDNGQGFIHNKSYILDAWHEHRLFGLQMCTTESISKKHPPFYGNPSKSHMYPYLWANHHAGEKCVEYAFPLFCMVEHAGCREKWPEGMNSIEILWIAKRARGVGLGRRMSNEMRCTSVSNPLPEAVEFWRKVGFEVPTSTDKKRKLDNAEMSGRGEPRRRNGKTAVARSITLVANGSTLIELTYVTNKRALAQQ